jgi:hypothetical protein
LLLDKAENEVGYRVGRMVTGSQCYRRSPVYDFEAKPREFIPVRREPILPVSLETASAPLPADDLSKHRKPVGQRITIAEALKNRCDIGIQKIASRGTLQYRLASRY